MTALRIRYVNVKFGNSDAIKFVANSWLKSYQEYVQKHIDGEMDNRMYFQSMVPITNRLMKHRRIVVAELADMDDSFVGWICGSQGELCYVYVKKAYRRAGIAKELIKRVCGHQGIYRYPSKHVMFDKWLERSFVYQPIQQNERYKTDGTGETDDKADPKSVSESEDRGRRESEPNN